MRSRTSKQAIEHQGKVLRGMGVSYGIVYGKAFILDQRDLAIPKERIPQSHIPAEIARLREALDRTEGELREMRRKIEERVGRGHASIFDAHLLMLRDAALIEETEQRIQKEFVNAEFAVQETMNAFAKAFDGIEDSYLKGRIGDVEDVAKRVLLHLMGERTCHVLPEGEQVIIVAHDLAPSDTAQMHKETILGFCTDVGSKVSHTAIMARALGIPAVVGLGSITQFLSTGDHIILDANRGCVLINPDEESVKRFMAEGRKFEVVLKKIRKGLELPAVRVDGRRVRVSANIELQEEAEGIQRQGAEGVGLYRTEFFYLNRADLPTEEEQFVAYSAAAKFSAPHPVVIRTCDLGGDKFFSPLSISPEVSDFMGWRAIRFSLQRLDVFQTQLTAILRASATGDVKVMFPMISGIGEVRRAKEALEEAKDGLRKRGEPFNETIQVGAMIEVPSAALTSDVIAKEVDFFSIGTNDLIQYTLAVNRINEKIAHLYDPAHPAIMRLLKIIIDEAHKQGIWVGMCGEMAGDPLFCPLLLGMGLDQFSMAPLAIPEIKKMVRACSHAECVEMVEHVTHLVAGDEVKAFLKKKLKKLVPDMDRMASESPGL